MAGWGVQEEEDERYARGQVARRWLTGERAEGGGRLRACFTVGETRCYEVLVSCPTAFLNLAERSVIHFHSPRGNQPDTSRTTQLLVRKSWTVSSRLSLGRAFPRSWKGSPQVSLCWDILTAIAQDPKSLRAGFPPITSPCMWVALAWQCVFPGPS